MNHGGVVGEVVERWCKGGERDVFSAFLEMVIVNISELFV